MTKAFLDPAHELPEHSERIAMLRSSDPHFARMFDAYTSLNRQIEDMRHHESTPDEALEAMKKQRLAMKDDIYRLVMSPQPG